MVERHDAMLLVPGLRGRFRIAEQRLDARVVRALAEDGVKFAVEQHLDNLLALRRALRGVDEFGDMGIFERDPPHACEIEAVVVREHAAQPRPGCRREGAYADPLAGESNGVSVPCSPL